MAATEPLIFDAIRTPRGKGKVNGSLHATKPVDLVVGLMHEMLSRNPELDPNRSTTSCSAASRRSATRAPTSPRPRRSRPGCRTPSPACSSTASAPPAWRPSTSPPRRSPPAGRTSSGPAASSRCRACRWAPTAAPGRWTPRPPTTPRSSRRAIGADLIATIEELQPRGRRRLRRALAGARRRPRRPRAASRTRSIPVLDINDQRRARPRRVHPPGHDRRDARRAEAVVRRDGRDGRLRRGGAAEVPLGREDRPRPHARATRRGSSTAPRWWRSATSRPAPSWACAPRARILATAVSGADPTIMLTGPAPAVARRRWPRPA